MKLSVPAAGESPPDIEAQSIKQQPMSEQQDHLTQDVRVTVPRARQVSRTCASEESVCQYCGLIHVAAALI